MISEKQKKIMAFPFSKYDALICDGAIRSGKTSIMFITYVDWAMREFKEKNFAICGKTVGSAIKNIIQPYLSLDYAKKKYGLFFTHSDNKLVVSDGNAVNTFYLYGGKDESSYMLIQGITLAGVFLDEVALMTRSFVEQALARCSVTGSRYFFNCNPENPKHWFYKEWVLKSKEKNALHLHFVLKDNPSLSDKVVERYEKMYAGVFYQRYIKGEWVVADGLVYQNFNENKIIDEAPQGNGTYYISCDYGITNPFSAHLYKIVGDTAYVVGEYYFNQKERGYRRTDEEHYAELDKLARGLPVEYIIIDPSATSMKETINRHDYFDYCNARNDVLNGISNTTTILESEHLKICSKCENMIEEFGLYTWDSKSDKDAVIKENDHAMDDLRYFVNTVLINEFDWFNWNKKEQEE